tara:strand:- start:71 stop:373 length:303 start_codon:yes stop_codon:yes gene_type:complete
MQELRTAASNGHNGAIRALEIFRHRLLQMLGAMAASLREVDVLALTGGIGEHKQQLQQALGWWEDVETIVVPADEERMITRLCRRLRAPDQTSGCSAAIR